MQPLAERLRPRTLDEYIGQKHLVGPGAVLRKMIDAGRISSFILWGPPGVGKTTLAQIIANKLETPFYTLSAVTSGVKDVRDVIERAKSNRFFSQASPILFIDEIHRFSKSQQDSLLGAVEQGTVTLIGATTENPSFEVIRPLLSRCQLYTLKSLEKDDLLELLQRAITTDTVLKERKIELKETTAMLRFSGGDARKLLNILELVIDSEATDPVLITDDMVTERLQQNPLAYDKDGEMHYDIISAFIKSIRGSDPDGAIYWLARMVEGGEDPAFIARRLVISASEDIGLANPNALLLANACFDTLMKVGWPEGRIPSGGSHRLPRHKPEEQLRLHGHQQCPRTCTPDRQSPRTLAPAQCAHQADEAVGLRREVQVRPRLPRQLRQAAIPARRIERPPYLGATTQPCRAEAQGTDAATLGRGKEMVNYQLKLKIKS